MSTMPPGETPLPHTNDREDRDETTVTGLDVQGTLPAGLSGRLYGIGPEPHSDGSVGRHDGVVRSVHLHAGQAMSYRSRRVITDAVAQRFEVDETPGPRNNGPDIVASNIVSLGGSILAFGDGSLAYELTSDLHTIRRVDLAGQSRGLAGYPRHDPVTDGLHLLAVDVTGAQAHVIVSSGALTRTNRPIAAAPQPINDLVITRDHVVFAADGFVGVAPREGDAHITWITTGVEAPYLVHAHDAGDTIVVNAVTPSLERWTLHAQSATIHREVLDPTPRRWARTNPADEVPRFLWTTGDGTVDKLDLTTATQVRHLFPSDRQPGNLEFVADSTRPSDADGGWLVGFVQHNSGDACDLIVLDAADIARPPIATVRIPRRIHSWLRCTWIPSTDH